VLSGHSLPSLLGFNPLPGTNQDSPLFYARLFGLLTPQAALGVIAAILAATRIPADVSRTQPAVTYTRLASMEVEVVGRLTGGWCRNAASEQQSEMCAGCSSRLGA
jgi:hypothetical protein